MIIVQTSNPASIAWSISLTLVYLYMYIHCVVAVRLDDTKRAP